MTPEQKFVVEYLELCKKHGLQLEARDYEGIAIDEYSESEYSDSHALIRLVGLIPKVETKHKPLPFDPILKPYQTPLLSFLMGSKSGEFTWRED